MIVNVTIVFKDRNSVPSLIIAAVQFSNELSSSIVLNVIDGSVSIGKLQNVKVQFYQILVTPPFSNVVTVGRKG